MGKLGFKCTGSDGGVYTFTEKGKTIIAIVDDAMFMGSDKDLVMKKRKEFMKIWDCHDLGEPKEFLGMRIQQDHSKKLLILDQKDYLEKIIDQFRMSNFKDAKTPLPSSWTP